MAKNVLANVGYTGSIPDPGRCLIAIKPMGHNYCACALHPASHNYGSPHSRVCAPKREATAVRSPGTAAATRESPLTAMKTQHKQNK